MKNKSLFLLVIFIFLSTSVSAQTIITGLDAHHTIPGTKLIRYTSRSSYPNHIIFSNQKAQSLNEANYLVSLLGLPKGYDLKPVGYQQDNIGFIHQEYKQYYKGIPVENGVYKVHIKNGNIESMNGDIYKVDMSNTIPSIPSSQAILNAKSFINSQKYKWEDGKRNSLSYYPTCELVIVIYANKTYLAYKVDVYSIQPLSRKFVYVDAVSGEVIYSIDRIHDVDTPGTGNTVYSGTKPIMVDFNGVDYTLTESGRGIETINSLTSLPYSNSSVTWNYSGLDQYALDAHWGAEMTYDYYFNTHGRDGLDGAHYFLTSYVNEGPGFGNAYWDGISVHYGDGDGSTFTTPLTSIGIVGHEMTHGLTQFTAGLIYMNESGALNESFSDIFGLCVDEYARNINLSLPASWLVGAECTSGIGIRNLANPNAFGHPDTYLGTNWVPAGGFDNGGVHSNSGVQNFWFYLLTMGGVGTNDNADSYSVVGIGIDNAAAIAYRNLSFYLTPGSDFADSRYYSLLAAEDLFGTCSVPVQSTANAWYAVGVGPQYQNLTLASFINNNSISCTSPIPVSFSNLSFNSSAYLWSFGDGDTSSLENPVHSYSAAGTYNVQLIANGCGANFSDTFETSITIAVGSSTVNMDPLQPSYISCCSGSLYDSGGPSSNYSDGESSNSTVVVPPGNVVNIQFTEFALETGFDFLVLYDGPNSTYPVIGSYSGIGAPNGGLPIVATSNAIYVQLISDGTVTYSGFAFNWYCTPPAPPVADFTSNITTVCVGSSIDYYNNSIYADSVFWDFQGGSPGSSNADTVVVLYNTVGTYTTSLTASNILGTNSSTSTVTVVPLPSPSISLVGNLASVTPTFSSYQWYLNGNPISGATSETYTVTEGGSYYCAVTDNNGCSNSTTNVFSTLDVENNELGTILIYPNPTSSFINFNNSIFTNEYFVSVTNVLGEVIYSSFMSSVNASIDLSNVQSGTYFVRLTDGITDITQKIVVIK